MKVQVIRNVKTPTRGTERSAGIDFYAPNDYKETDLEPNQSALIPSGIKAEIPSGYALIAFNKSGVATKQGLQVGACVVDESYRAEIHLHVINVSDKKTTIMPGQKLVQFVLLPVNYAEIEFVHSIEEHEENRGAFGSTGLF
jgi:dUTP pyrophosphatase